jgi:hypothetical protein
LSVGWCPSKRVVVIHYARPYTAQKASGGCVTAISGSASKFAEDTCYGGGSGNRAGGGEMEYDGRVAGIGASAGKEGDMGRIGQIGGGGKWGS